MVDAEQILDTVFAGMKEMITPLLQRVAALEADIKQLRQMGYAGVYQRALATEYHRNVLVTHDGALWCALKDSPAGVPGQSGDWQLAAKSR